jgi:hypothetical protein
MADEILYEKLISNNDIKEYQLKLVISEFKGINYLSLRKYFLSFDEDYIPSKEGISMEYEMDSSLNLLAAMLEVIPLGECKHMLDAKLLGD